MTLANPKRIRIAVITDLHYVEDLSVSPAKYRPQMSTGQTFDPMEKLQELIVSAGLQADLLLCPGDITNHAEHNAFLVGWKNLKDLRDKLGARELIAVTGNHEVQSRPIPAGQTVGLSDETIDPVGKLQSVEDYPAAFNLTPDKRWIYWGKGYEIIELDNVVIVMINTCHFHSTMQPLEYERGKISDIVLESFKSKIDQIAESKKFRIVLMHHHPISQVDADGHGQINMYNGSRLTEILNESCDDWLIIHGHKHNPRLIRAQGTNGQPIVFSAGSFGAALSGILATKTKNQFYILNLEAIENSNGTSEMRGNLEAYFWSATEWRLAVEYEHGIPNGCGFTNNVDINSVAADIVSMLGANPGSFVKWPEIVATFPILSHLMPDEITRLRKILKRQNVTSGGDDRHWFPGELSL